MKQTKTYTVIIDTNPINPNGSFTSFFGGQGIIQKLQDNDSGVGICKIVIPKMVIEELTRHKKTLLQSTIANMKKNLQYIKNSSICSNIMYDELYKGLELYSKPDELNTKIEQLQKEESEHISIIDFPPNEDLTQTFKDIIQHILDQKPPYVEKRNNDSFKDVVIYYTILTQHYTQENNVYFITNDGDFKNAFSKNDNITVVSSYQEFVDKELKNRF